MPRRIFFSVAEVSGDLHAAQVIKALKQLDATIVCEGLGGPAMRNAGATIHHETVTNAAMGWRGALRAFEFRRLLKWTKQHLDANRPDLVVCVDSSGVNFHFCRTAHDRGIPVMYYIAPQVWASREGRLKKIRKWVDHVACIWQFEEEYFRRHGVTATYVGHPLFDELPAHRFNPDVPRFPARPPVIGLLGGSRRSDATANFPHMLDVAARIRQQFPDVTFLAPTTAATDPVIRELSKDFARAGDCPIEIALDGMDAMVPRCDLCITKSGTSTLHVAAWGVPMIVVYRVSPILWHLLGRWVIKTRTYTMVNMLADSHDHIVPEYIPWYGSNEPVARRAIDYLQNPARLDEQRQRLLHLIHSIDRPGAAMNTAKLAMNMI